MRALERGAGRGLAVAARSRPPRSSPPDHDALDPGEVAARSRSRRSRRPPTSSATSAAWPSPTSSATAPAPSPRRLEPGAAPRAGRGSGRGRPRRRAAPRAARNFVISGCQRRPVGVADVGQVGERRGRSARGAGSAPTSKPTRSASPSAAAFSRGQRRAPSAEVSIATTSAAGQLVGDRQRDRPRPGADVEHRRRRELERDLDQQLGLGPRDQRPARRSAARGGESRGGRGCRRPARGGRAGAPSRRTRAPPAASTAASGSAASAARSRPRRLGEQQLGVEPRRVSTPAAASASDRGLERLGDRSGRGHRPHSAPAACASSLRRFSSAASASLNSRRSPARISSSAWLVSLIRWSVTRPCGKL